MGVALHLTLLLALLRRLDVLVLQGVALHLTLLLALLRRLDHALDLLRVDDARQVRVRHGGAEQVVALLLLAAALVRAEERLELLDRGLRPDDEPAQGAARRELQQVEARHAAQVDARDGAEGTRDAVVLRVDDERAAAHSVAAVARLALARADLLAGEDLVELVLAAGLLEQLDRLLRLR